MSAAADGARKLRRAGALARRWRRQAAGPRLRPSVYVYPTSGGFERAQRHAFSRLRTLYPEDLANFEFLRRLFAERFVAARRPEEADFLFLPLFLTPLILGGCALDRQVAALELPAARGRTLVFSSLDWVARRAPARANPRCFLSGRAVDERACPAWLDERFTLLGFESTLDSSPRDLALLPLVGGGAAPPATDARPLLYSCVGTLLNPDLPRDHVRGPGRIETWRALAAERDAFVGTLPEARRRFGATFHHSQLYRQSRFVLCPAGYARWSFRLSEAIGCGAVPVILSDFYLKPFSRQLAWDDFSITLPESALGDVGRILRAVSAERLAHYRARLDEARAALSPAGVATLIARELEDRRC